MIHPNFSPVAFTIPGIQFDVYWYAIIFSFGMLLALHLYGKILSEDGLDKATIDNHSSYVLVIMSSFSIFFARLFEGIFYSPQTLLSFSSFFHFRSGGLASHGGILGLFLGLYFIKPPSPLSSIKLLDRLALCAIPLLALIRVGNFANQELVGRPCSQPWCVVFPAFDAQARHPAVLYESLVYFALFFIFWSLRHAILFKSQKINDGVFGFSILTLFLIARVICEEFKLEQSHWMLLLQEDLPFTMGQVLSILFLVPVVVCLLITLISSQKKESA